MYLSKVKMDLTLCRLCYENIGVTYLFDTTDFGEQLSEKIKYCAKVDVSQEDCLPAYICECCEEELAAASRFLQKCEQTDKKLRSLQIALKEELDTKNDVKMENLDDNSFPADSFLETYESHDSPIANDIKKEEPERRTKRKYVRRKPLIRKSSKSAPIKCEVCGRLCSCPSVLAIHMRSHTNEKPHSCPSCHKSYKDGGTLKRHMERNHDDNRTRSYICELCGQGFYSKSDCKIHMRIHTGERPYACKKCDARFTQIGSLKRHKLTHTGEKPHMCSKCSKTFATSVQLKTHYSVHSDERKFKCLYCDVQYKSESNLKKHTKMHLDEVIKRFICDYCDRSFLYKINLQCHITKMHSSKSGYCSECTKNFPNIEMHRLKHAGVRAFKCELCTSSFFDLRGLSKHVGFQHKYADKYKCTFDGCTLCFPSRPMLEYHVMRYHKSIKPFTCDQCPRSFYRKSDMVRHQNGTHKI